MTAGTKALCPASCLKWTWTGCGTSVGENHSGSVGVRLCCSAGDPGCRGDRFGFELIDCNFSFPTRPERQGRPRALGVGRRGASRLHQLEEGAAPAQDERTQEVRAGVETGRVAEQRLQVSARPRLCVLAEKPATCGPTVTRGSTLNLHEHVFLYFYADLQPRYL